MVSNPKRILIVYTVNAIRIHDTYQFSVLCEPGWHLLCGHTGLKYTEQCISDKLTKISKAHQKFRNCKKVNNGNKTIKLTSTMLI